MVIFGAVGYSICKKWWFRKLYGEDFFEQWHAVRIEAEKFALDHHHIN